MGLKVGIVLLCPFHLATFLLVQVRLICNHFLKKHKIVCLLLHLGVFTQGQTLPLVTFLLKQKVFLLENGKTTTPLKAFTVSGNFYQLLKDIIGVGSDLAFDVPGSHSAFGSPSLLVKNLSLAGQ